MYSVAELIILAKAYIAATGVVESTLSTYAFGNEKTLPRLLEGADCTARTAERGSLWFDMNWPLGVAWPAQIVCRRRVAPPRPRARGIRLVSGT